MLTPVEFHGEEVRARNGEMWLAFDGDRWKRVKLGIRAVKDMLVNEGHAKTGRAVSVAGEEPLILLRGYDRLLGTAVRRASSGNSNLNSPGADRLSISYELRGGAYQLRADAKTTQKSLQPRSS